MKILIIIKCGSTNPARRNNPVKEEFVYLPKEYKYSSAIDYAGGKGILEVEVIKWYVWIIIGL